MPPVSLHDLPMAIALGAGLGFFGGLFGIGGGIIAIPLLVIGYGLDQAVAQGTALVMMVPNLLIAWRRYSQHHPVPLATALRIGGVACATTWLTAHWATQLPPERMRAAFSLALLALAVHMLWPRSVGSNPRPDSTSALRSPRYLPWVGLVGGSSMGLLGVGGGLVATPIFSGWFGQRQTVAQSLSLALVAPSSVIALGTYSSAHQVDWAMGLPMALGGLFTVSAGVAVAHRLPEKRMQAAFGWMMLATALWLLVKPLLD